MAQILLNFSKPTIMQNSEVLETIISLTVLIAGIFWLDRTIDKKMDNVETQE